MPKQVDVMFDSSPVLHLAPDASLRGVRPVAWFDNKAPLRSGWAWGQHYLEGGLAGVEATLGKGRVFLFGPEITFRYQPHGTFKFLFNGIYYGTSTPVGAAARETTQQYGLDGLRRSSGTLRSARRRTRASRVHELGGKNRLASSDLRAGRTARLLRRAQGEPSCSPRSGRPARGASARESDERRSRESYFSTISAFSFPTTSSSSCRSFAGTLN